MQFLRLGQTQRPIIQRPIESRHLIASRLAENLEHEPRCDHLFILTWRQAVASPPLLRIGTPSASTMVSRPSSDSVW
jgi:hypothetical protein